MTRKRKAREWWVVQYHCHPGEFYAVKPTREAAEISKSWLDDRCGAPSTEVFQVREVLPKERRKKR